MAFEIGQQVRITEGHDQFGLLAHPEATRFEEGTVTSGDVGTFEGPHRRPALAEQGWVLVSFTFGDGRERLWCPLDYEWIEAV